MVNMSMDDYIKVVYNSENEEFLKEQITKNEQEAYKTRFSGISRDADPESRQKYVEDLGMMNEAEYKYMKMTQMRQLFSAYSERTHGNMWVEPGDTNPEHVRRVVGPNARFSLNTGIMALTNDEISAISYLSNKEHDSFTYGDRRFTSDGLYNAVQELIAIRDLTCDRYAVEYPQNTVSAFARDTIAGQIVYDSHRTGQEYGYTLESVSQIVRKCKSPLHRAGKKLVEWLNSKPQERKDPSRLGDQTMEIDEQGE